MVHERTAKRMERTRTTATTTKTDTASRHRFAHFTSVRRIDSISSSRSISDFDSSQSGGADRGESRIRAPATQKRGNTAARSGQHWPTTKTWVKGYSRKPNLKRYIASVGWSDTGVYAGGSTHVACS